MLTGYEIRTSVNSYDKNNLKATVELNNRLEKMGFSKKPSTVEDEKIILDFDPQSNVFYNGKEYVNHSFTVYNMADNTARAVKFRGKFPTITIGEDKYYFIGNTWYFLNRTPTGDPGFIQYASRCSQ